MEESGKVPQLKAFCSMNRSSESGFGVNKIFNGNPCNNCNVAPSCCMDANDSCRSECARAGGFWSEPAHPPELRDPAERQEKPASLHLHHQLPGGRRPAVDSRQGDARGPRCCWSCASGQRGPTLRDTVMGRYEDMDQLQSDLGFLEPPLPLRSDDEWPDCSAPVPPQHHIHNYDLHRPVDVRYVPSVGAGQFNVYSINPPHPCHYSAPCQLRPDFNNLLRPHNNLINDSRPRGGVTVNMPQFSLPPAESVSQIGVMNLSSAGADVAVSQEKTRTVSLPDECRNIFITHSSDAAAEMVPFVDFLTKQGFRPAIDTFDNSTRCMDINKWMDIYLKDQSVLIIIAISPKYKEDIEGFGEDRHGLHAKYFYSMMQNEFIQQRSLNFRFIPVLFLNTSQRHVPGWLQNTCVYRWPQDAEDLLLRLLREERYAPPPASMELTLIIRPLNPSDAAGL